MVFGLFTAELWRAVNIVVVDDEGAYGERSMQHYYYDYDYDYALAVE